MWLIGLLPQEAKAPVAGASASGWATLTRFVNIQIFVAFVDALGIGLGAFFLGLPLVVPIAVAVFLGAFVPIIGAFVTGALAIFIALVYAGPIAALIMLIIRVCRPTGRKSRAVAPRHGHGRPGSPAGCGASGVGRRFCGGNCGCSLRGPVVAYLNVFISYLARSEWVGDPAVVRWLSPRAGASQ